MINLINGMMKSNKNYKIKSITNYHDISIKLKFNTWYVKVVKVFIHKLNIIILDNCINE